MVSKHYLKTKDGADVFVTKCNMTVKGCTVGDLFATYWNTQGTWDFASTSAVQILEDRGNSQIVYLQHKVLSAASVKKDCVIERTSTVTNSTAKAYATSVVHKDRPEKYNGYGRSFLIFHACYIQETSPGTLDFTFVHCYDFNGWVHDKFVIAEKAKTAARMNKIVRGTKNAQIVPVTNPLQVNSTSNSQSSSGNLQRSVQSNSYADYNAMIREAQPTFVPEPSNPNQMPPSQGLRQQQPTSNNAPTSGPNFCPSCGASAKGMRFCQGCGTKLF